MTSSASPTSLTAEQILALAPDSSAAKAGRELANARKWVLLGCNELAAWGECQGSGAKPYQTQIDLADTAFACSCPSRKHPCKHSLGLFLLLVGQPDSFSGGPGATPPEWVTKWLEGRSRRAQKAVAHSDETPADPATAATKAKSSEAAQTKRGDQREQRVASGLAEIEAWLRDLVRGGLAAAQSQPTTFWERPAKRMVDAQAPGVARLIRQMAGTPQSGDGWDGRLLEQIGRLHLLVAGYGQRDALPPAVQADVRSLVGWTQGQDEVLALPGQRDQWLVLGMRVEEEDKLRVKRTWLRGIASAQSALILSFAAPGQPLDTSLLPGTTLDADLSFFPSAVPQRALIKERRGAPGAFAPIPGDTILAATAAYAQALARQPWLERFPLLLADVVAQQTADAWALRDSTGHILPLAPHFDAAWQLMAVSGGHPLTVFGEWDGRYLLPLSVWGAEFAQL